MDHPRPQFIILNFEFLIPRSGELKTAKHSFLIPRSEWVYRTFVWTKVPKTTTCEFRAGVLLRSLHKSEGPWTIPDRVYFSSGADLWVRFAGTRSLFQTLSPPVILRVELCLEALNLVSSPFFINPPDPSADGEGSAKR